ncbi:MAG: hypothetical protein IT379_22585 [Deltaproteobacteria bacterium]|nr:hypothetical protein [Deltaproteobacteria bacterium]
MSRRARTFAVAIVVTVVAHGAFLVDAMAQHAPGSLSTNGQRVGGSDERPLGSDRVARVRQLFPSADRWFRIVGGQRFATQPDGALVPRHETLTHSRVRWQDGAGQRVTPRFPARFRGPLRVASSVSAGAWIELTPLDGVDPVARVVDGLVVYEDAFRDTDVIFKSTPTHLDEYLVLWSPDAPTRWRYRVRLGPALRSLRTLGRESLEALDDNGTPWLRTQRPVAFDRSGRRVEGTLALEGDELVLALDTRDLDYPILVDPDWRSTGDMAEGRFYHRSVVLPDGRMLVTGGCSASVCSGGLGVANCRNHVRFAEALDVSTRAFSRVASDIAGRILHVTEALSDGRVLVAGGCANSTCDAANASAAILDPLSGAFREIAPPPDLAAGAAVAPLPDGRILVAGGCIGTDCTTSAAAFDPETESWAVLAAMHVARARATVTVLSDGRVLVAGGCSAIGCSTVIADAEIYDPARDAWDHTAPMAAPRAGHFAARLLDGRVLLGGGCSEMRCMPALRSTEVFDPTTMAFTSAAELTQPRFGVEAIALPDGSVMVSQGCSSATECDLTNELFDPIATSFAPIEPAVTSRAFHTLVMHQPSRSVIANGGCQPSTCSWWNETYDVSGITPVEPPPPPPPPPGRDGGAADAARADTGSSMRPEAGSPSGTDAAARPHVYVPPSCACRIAPGTARHRAAATGCALVVLAALVLRALSRRRRDEAR